jgi:hypothetical protein
MSRKLLATPAGLNLARPRFQQCRPGHLGSAERDESSANATGSRSLASHKVHQSTPSQRRSQRLKQRRAAGNRPSSSSAAELRGREQPHLAEDEPGHW